ncbi:hypothetical protein OQA88_5387 [Cercophora sp. LCS_1]
MAFYKAVFGWMDHCDVQEPMPGYMEGVDNVTMFYKGTLYGAFVKMTKPEGVAAVADADHLAKMPLLPSFKVDNIDETLDVVAKNGGKVHLPKLDIAGGTMGYSARFIDTEGNLVAIWQPPAKET